MQKVNGIEIAFYLRGPGAWTGLAVLAIHRPEPESCTVCIMRLEYD